MSRPDERTWIKVGDSPRRYELAYHNSPPGPDVHGSLAYVEEEPAGWWRWEDYRRHDSGSCPDRAAAQAAAEQALEATHA
jgi:hypothetical protein